MGVVLVRPQAIQAMVDAVAELDEKGDAYVAEVLERETFEEHVARAAAQAFLATEELQPEYDLAPHAAGEDWEPVRRVRLCGPWRRDDDE